MKKKKNDMDMESILFDKGKKRKIPRTVQQSIPYTRVYENGTIETLPGRFSRAYELADINFKIAPEEDQAAIFLEYGRILNSFDKDTTFQILIHNHAVSKRKTMEDIRYLPQRDGLNQFRQELNTILIDKITEGKNNLSQDKYLVVSVENTKVDQAMKSLDNVDRQVAQMFKKISREQKIEPQSLYDRLRILHSIYNIGKEGDFYNDRDDQGRSIFNMDKIIKLGMSSKDIVGPSGMDFGHSSYFKLGSVYGRVMYMADIPSFLTTEYISDLADAPFNLLISITYVPVDPTRASRIVKDMMLAIDGEIAKQQKQASKSGYAAELISPELLRQQKHARGLMDDMLSRDQKMYLVTLSMVVFGNTREELEANTKTISTISSKHLCAARTLFFQQEIGFNSSLPLCLNELPVSKMLTTESASIFIPYTTQEIQQKHGIAYGQNISSKNMIIYNRLTGPNYNGLILGESGSGKSYQAKYEMISAFLKDPRNYIYVIDPQEEYVPIAREMGGEVLDLSPNSQKYINPLDMDIRYGDGINPVAAKADYIISMIEIMMGGGRTIDPEGRSIITRCTQNIYKGYLRHLDEQAHAGRSITCDRDAMPTLNNLYQEISVQPELASKTLTAVLEMYAKGALSTFAHRSNIDTDARFLVYSIKKLGAGTKNLALYVCLNDILNKVYDNYTKGYFTWFYIDEMSLLLGVDSAAQFLSQTWKTVRKWNGVPTGIMQNTEDLLRSTEARNILNNTSFIRLMSLPKIDRLNIAELLSISDSQLEYITNSSPGHGLFYTGKSIIPFVNELPDNTRLHKLMSTTTSDVDEIKKRLSYIGG